MRHGLGVVLGFFERAREGGEFVGDVARDLGGAACGVEGVGIGEDFAEAFE
jgi:hypothetical protein